MLEGYAFDCYRRKVSDGMDLLGFKKAKANQQKYDNIIERAEHDTLCLQNGWRPWTGETTNEKTEKAIRDIWSGKDYTLYPPGYTEEPVITEGKLQVDPEPETKRRCWFW